MYLPEMCAALFRDGVNSRRMQRERRNRHLLIWAPDIRRLSETPNCGLTALAGDARV